MTRHGPVVADQRGPIQDLDGVPVLEVERSVSVFGGLLGVVEVDGVIYTARTTPEVTAPYLGARLVLADETGRELWRSKPYTITPAQGVIPRNYGGGLAAHEGRVLLGYGYRLGAAGVGDHREGGVVSVDPATGAVDTIAVGLRSPWKLAVWGDDLLISSPGVLTWDGIYRAPISATSLTDFGYPQWEGPLCHTTPDCPAHTGPWLDGVPLTVEGGGSGESPC